VEYTRDELGRITEVPPATLDCGHPFGPGRVTVGYEWHEPSQARVRMYVCRACGEVTFHP